MRMVLRLYVVESELTIIANGETPNHAGANYDGER